MRSKFAHAHDQVAQPHTLPSAGEVVVVHLWSPLAETVAAVDVHHAVVVGVALQHRVAEREERRCRAHVVFEHDGAVDLPERGVDPAHDATGAPEVLVGEVEDDVAGPVDLGGRGARRVAQLGVVVVTRERAVGHQEERAGAGFAQRRQQLGGALRAVVDDRDDGRRGGRGRHRSDSLTRSTTWGVSQGGRA